MKNILIKVNDNNSYNYDNLDVFILKEGDSFNLLLKNILNKYSSFNLIISINNEIIAENNLNILFECLNDPMVGVISPSIIINNNTLRGEKSINIIKTIYRNLGLFKNYINKKYILYDDYRYETSLTIVDIPNSDFYIFKSDLLKTLDLNKEIPFYYFYYILSDISRLLNKQILINNDVKLNIKTSSNLINYKLFYKDQYKYYINYKKSNYINKILLFISIKMKVLFLNVKGEKNYDL